MPTKTKWDAILFVYTLPFVGLSIIALTLWVYVSSPSSLMSRSASDIRKAILSETPLNCSREAVTEVIARHGWEIAPTHRQEFGFYRDGVVVGATSIYANLGTYRESGFDVYVSIYWGFDEHGRLVDIWVRKDIDAP